jgi:hypothetical protein
MMANTLERFGLDSVTDLWSSEGLRWSRAQFELTLVKKKATLELQKKVLDFSRVGSIMVLLTWLI